MIKIRVNIGRSDVTHNDNLVVLELNRLMTGTETDYGIWQ